MVNLSLSAVKKEGLNVQQASVEDVEQVEGVEAQKIGTPYDKRDMTRMGKLQQLRRNFHFFSIFGYAVILGNTWEFALITGVFSLVNGGTAGAIWMFLVVCFGMFFIMLSMAEMASIAPTAGGQYHWVSEFSPPEYQKFLSYTVGWMCVLGWQSSVAAVGYTAAQQFEALINLADPTYVAKPYQGTLFTIGISLFVILFNTLLIRKLPLFEGIIMILHVFGFFAVVVVLWVMGPRGDAKEVLTHFEDNAGWGNIGVACLVSILGPIVTLIGADSSCHLSEELKDAAWVLPRSMVATAIVNYSMGLVMTVTLMFTLGDVQAVLASPTGQPYVGVIQNATQSYAGTVTLTAVVAILMVACGVNQITTSSRQLFAFARDKGLPFSDFLGHVRPGWDIPANAVAITMLVTAILSLIILGSSIAFNIILSIGLTGLLSSYIVVIGCVAAKRIRGEPFPPSRFSLGKAGLPVNIIAICWLSLALVFVFFPSAPHPSPAGMNWSCLIYGSCVIFFLAYYYVRGRYTYQGPVIYVKHEM